jgi:hypothetical protein
MANSPSIKTAILSAWANSLKDPAYPTENGFYILRDPTTGALSTQAALREFGSSAIFGKPPADAIVMFHTHPNPSGKQVILNGKPLFNEQGEPQVWLPGPSVTDLRTANVTGLPGIILSDRGVHYYGPRLRPSR